MDFKMKEKILAVLKSKLLFALVINLAIMVLCVIITSFVYDSSNDFYNSINIAKNHFYYSSSINYIAAVLIGTVQYVFSEINCFVAAQVFLSYISFTAITFVFCDKFNSRKAFTFTLVINLLFALNHYSTINSDRTAALGLIAGFLLVLNAIHNKRYNLPCWIGVAIICGGSFFNFYYFFVALGFACAFFFGDLIAKKKYKLPFRKLFWYFRPFLLMFIFVTLIVLGLNQFSYTINHATDEAENYYEYSAVVNKINNLPFPSYDDYEEEFNEIGVKSDSDYELLKNGYYDPEKSLNTETLKSVSEIQREDNPDLLLYSAGNIFADIASHFSTFDVTAFVTVFFVLLSVVFIVTHKKRFAFFPAFYIITGFIAGTLIRYFFSGTTSMIYGIWLMMVVLLLYSFNFDKFRYLRRPIENLRQHNGYWLISCAAMIVMTLSYSIVFVTHVSLPEEDDKPYHLLEELGRTPDKYYVFDVPTINDFYTHTENYIHPMWGFSEDYLENIDSFGYFHNNEDLRKRNLPENIYQAVLRHNKIYVIDQALVFKKEKYFTENYVPNGKNAVYELIDEFDSYKIYKVVIL